MQLTVDPTPILLPDLGGAVLRLAVATVAGAIIGLDRDLRGKPAGVRTHGLVALGSALVTLVSVHFAFTGDLHDGNPVTRTIQGIIAGIGFLGAGVILKTTTGSSVRGLTTSATIWVVACLGISAGSGLLGLTGIAAAFTFAVLILGGPFEQAMRRVFGPSPAERRRARRERRQKARRLRTRARELEGEAAGQETPVQRDASPGTGPNVG